MDRTCKTCRWWDRGSCEMVDTIAAENPATRFEIDVEVADDTGLRAWLRTGPDFGCVLHMCDDQMETPQCPK